MRTIIAKNTSLYVIIALFFLLLVDEKGFAHPIDFKKNVSVSFFYGKHPPLAKLCQYDWAIVVPDPDFSPHDYCNTISQPIAYVSVGEVAHGVSYESEINKPWIMGRNKAWNNNIIIDQTKADWQTFFMDKLITPLWNQGYRGFFFDTLDSYQLAVHDAPGQQLQIQAMESLITRVKERFPEAIIILNRGFKMLPVLAPKINAVVIESLYQSWNQATHQYEKTAPSEQKWLFSEIKTIRSLNLPIIVIDYLPADKVQERAQLSHKIKSQGLIPWITNEALNTVYDQTKPALERQILILYESELKQPIRYVSAVRFLGAILEYLGYIPFYQELTQYCPKHQCPSEQHYAGIILWIDSPHENNQPILQWVKKQTEHGTPAVFLQGFGVPIETPVLKAFGLATGNVKSSGANLKITQLNSHFIGEEMAPSLYPYDFFPIRASESNILLQVQNEFQQREDAVAITPWGGYALNPYVIQYFPDLRPYWVMNPFEFLSSALRLKTFPIPDTTTESGRRLLSVHIDGDGFANPAKWLNGHIAAIELRDQVLKRFKIPTSLSVITGELSPDGIHPKNSKYLMRVAQSMFALPWVESASHSFSHPFSWTNDKQTQSLITSEGSYELNIPGYRFNTEKEILGSVAFINQYLVPPQRPCRLLFWSGMANPSAKQIALTYSAQLLNINGLSDTHISNGYRSLAGVRPMGLKLGEHYQVAAPIDMDFSYINDFIGPLYGFKYVIQTLKLTDQPRRLKPIDLYYHIYAASYPAMLNTLIQVYQWALKQSTMPIYISEYIEKVLDFYEIEITPLKEDWLITSKGHLRELRSSKELGYPDIEHSDNIVGFNEFNQVRYIHLGPGPVSLLKYQSNAPITPYLVDANARVTAWDRHANTYLLRLSGHVPIELTLANTQHCHIEPTKFLQLISTDHNQQRFHSNKDNLEIHIRC